MTITLTVAGRIATVEADGHVVAGNTYPVTLALDSEWTGSLYLRVRFGSLYYDIPFASSAASVDVQMPVGYPEVGIGVFSEALEICTSEARVRLLRSILEAGEQVVEFDSDLYEQWAGEVSELLCDDDFDAESQRPVKNSVITDWKNTVPLDSALVHKTGNESVAGQKTFTARMFVREPSIPSIHIVSETAYTATGWKGLVGFFDQKDGASNEAVGIYTSVASGEVNLGLRVHKPDRSGQFDTILRSYDDHQLIITTPYYPVDGSGNPQPIGKNALITSGNIAVDPRLVHTSGIETIAGEKSFTATLRAYKYRCEDATAYGSTQNKGAFVFSAKNEQGVMTDYCSMFLWQTLTGATKGNSLAVHVRSLDGTRDLAPFSIKVLDSDYSTRVGVMSHLPVDSGGVHLPPEALEIINSEMLAVDPRVIHTTGNETFSGIKTTTSSFAILSNGYDLDNPPSYTSRTFKEFKVKNGSQVVIREDATLASAGNAHRIIVHAHKQDGTDISATLTFVVYRDGTCRLGLTKPDGTEVNIVPRG